MNPEEISCAIEGYIDALQKQAAVAEAFFYGRTDEGMKGLLSLPKDVRLRIDQLIWGAAGGMSVNPADLSAGEFIADVILFSLEERMGMHAS